jgi:hypothetical protein
MQRALVAQLKVAKERDEWKMLAENAMAAIETARQLGMSIASRPEPVVWALKNERAQAAEAERDTLRAQLAAAQQQLRDVAKSTQNQLASDLVDGLIAQAAATQARERVMRETAELLSRVGNRIVLTVPERDNPHHRELERAVGLSIAPLAQPADDGALRELLMRAVEIERHRKDWMESDAIVEAVLRGER